MAESVREAEPLSPLLAAAANALFSVDYKEKESKSEREM